MDANAPIQRRVSASRLDPRISLLREIPFQKRANMRKCCINCDAAFAILLVDFIKGRGVCCKIEAQHVISVLETMYFWQRCDLVAPTSGGIGCCRRDVVVVASVVAHGVCVFV